MAVVSAFEHDHESMRHALVHERVYKKQLCIAHHKSIPKRTHMNIHTLNVLNCCFFVYVIWFIPAEEGIVGAGWREEEIWQAKGILRSHTHKYKN